MIENMTDTPFCATIGFFDGVHKGHKYIISQLINDAKTHEMESMVITFKQHPRQVLQQNYIPKLITICPRKEALLKATGVDNVLMLDFTREMSNLSAKEFMQVLRDNYNVRRLLIGYDNRFGHNRNEGFREYQIYGKELGVEVVALNAFHDQGLTYSSSMVRRMLNEGNIPNANKCLGYKYGFSGVVVHGFGEGRKLGFPTANIKVAEEQLIPKRGVYAVKVKIDGSNNEYQGMLSIGVRPTYGDFDETIEVNIFDFNEDIYDKTISVFFVKWIREEKKFNSIEELKEEMNNDKRATCRILNEIPFLT